MGSWLRTGRIGHEQKVTKAATSPPQFPTRLMVACLLVLAVTACNSSSPEGRPPMQIVTLESFDSPRVYVADWLGRRLKPRSLTELPADMRVVDATTSPGDNILAVVARRPPEAGGWKWEVYLVDPLTGRYGKVYEDERLGMSRIAIAPGKRYIAFLSDSQAPPYRTPSGLLWSRSDILLYEWTTQRVKPVLRGRA